METKELLEKVKGVVITSEGDTLTDDELGNLISEWNTHASEIEPTDENRSLQFKLRAMKKMHFAKLCPSNPFEKIAEL